MKNIFTAILTLLFCLPTVAFCQPKTLVGKVMNDLGEPVAKIAVMLKAAAKATLTANDGTFSISLKTVPDTLIFKGAGYLQCQYAITEKNAFKPMSVTLHAAGSALADVVVVGYGSSKMRGITSLPGIVTYKYAGAKSEDISSYEKAGTKMRTKLPAGWKNGNARSKILTAGEVSDFKKWKLWADYTESEFKTWSETWGIAPKSRYCVQVQNQDHQPVVGEKVYLINQVTKDTSWQAITDNTGKAELWSNLYHYVNDKNACYISCSNQVVYSPSVFENGINYISVKKVCNTSTAVDIAFVVDATGSMADEIHYLQEELQNIISKTADMYKDISLRSAAVFYRDHADEYLTRHIDFNNNPLPLVRFVKEQSAAGGGDFPEAVDAALTTALDSLQWSDNARTKILFLVLDAPPHDAAKKRMNELISMAALRGIRIVPVMCSGIDKSTEYLMRSIALATNGTYVFLTDDSGVGNKHIKPTTDEFTVELLNSLLQRVISEMVHVPDFGNKKFLEPINDTANSTLKITIYPNPTKGSVTIESAVDIKEMFIADFTGKVLMRPGSLTKKVKLKIDLSNNPSGTYLIKYFVEGKGWSIEKIVLLH